MPSIRKRVYGLIRTTFSPSPSVEDGEELESEDAVNGEETQHNNSFIWQYLSGGLKKHHQPELYYGKTGVDLPVIHLETFSRNVCASYTGPEGGLTEVPSVRKRPIANIANLDDELSLSVDGETLYGDVSVESSIKRTDESNYGLIEDLNALETTQHRTCYEYDWAKSDEKAFGFSTSLYEKHPITGVHAGNPIADVFGLIARENCCFLALADGVNWGDRARLAARCAIRGAIDHLNEFLIDDQPKTTLDVFHNLLGAFHAGHQLILQEGGMLTTLCVVVVAKVRNSESWVVCACNVGDSLCFVYNSKIGVREVTLGSHDICQMRDMRVAGGALGPVDGVNPELQNLTCSMTFVDDGDLVFITSDGVSDNFDPVVGKFCIIKKVPIRMENKENAANQTSSRKLNLPIAPQSVLSSNQCKGRIGSCGDKDRTEDDGGFELRNQLPIVDAQQRHELMLLRMEDLLSHGMAENQPLDQPCTAKELCEYLVEFSKQLSMAKRHTLEDPELYEGEKHLSRSDQRARRKMVRAKISEMPGKLDHATAVAYRTGFWEMEGELLKQNEDANQVDEREQDFDLTPTKEQQQAIFVETDAAVEKEMMIYNNINAVVKEKSDATVESKAKQLQEKRLEAFSPSKDDRFQGDPVSMIDGVSPMKPAEMKYRRQKVADVAEKESNETNEKSLTESIKLESQSTADWSKLSPYEVIGRIQNNTHDINNMSSERQRKKHARSSPARHTLSVDVGFLKRLMGTNNNNDRLECEQQSIDDQTIRSAGSGRSSFSLKDRLRDFGALLPFRGSQRQLLQTSPEHMLPVSCSRRVNGRPPRPRIGSKSKRSTSETHILLVNGKRQTVV